MDESETQAVIIEGGIHMTRVEILSKFFEVSDYETLLSNSQKTRSILMDLGMKTSEIAFINAIMETHSRTLKKQLFEVEGNSSLDDISKELVRGSFFSEDAVNNFLKDLYSAIQLDKKKNKKNFESYINDVHQFTGYAEYGGLNIFGERIISKTICNQIIVEIVKQLSDFQTYDNRCIKNEIKNLYHIGLDPLQLKFFIIESYLNEQAIKPMDCIVSDNGDASITMPDCIPKKYSQLYLLALDDIVKAQTILAFHLLVESEWTCLLNGKSDSIEDCISYIRTSGAMTLEAFRLCSRAAELGDGFAMWILGFLYSKGIGVDRSNQNAKIWFERSILAGNSFSYYELARMSEVGEKPGSVAVSLYMKGANENCVPCMVMLALQYLHGVGIKKSVRKAEELFEKASDLGDYFSTRYLAKKYYHQGDRGKESEYYSRLFGYDDVETLIRIAYLCEDRRIRPPRGSFNEAIFECYKRAAELGDVSSMYKVAQLYEAGHGVSKSNESAYTWYEKAAKAGNAMAKLKLCSEDR